MRHILLAVSVLSSVITALPMPRLCQARDHCVGTEPGLSECCCGRGEAHALPPTPLQVATSNRCLASACALVRPVALHEALGLRHSIRSAPEPLIAPPVLRL
jgi:hypothetical protein